MQYGKRRIPRNSRTRWRKYLRRSPTSMRRSSRSTGTRTRRASRARSRRSAGSRRSSQVSDKTGLEAAHLYIDLLMRCVSNSIYDDDMDMMRGQMAVDDQTGRYVPLEAAPASMEEKYLG